MRFSKCASILNISGFDKLLKIYKEIDEKVNMFSNLTKISCPGDCKFCCNTKALNVGATVFEMLPLCIKIYSEKKNDFYNDKIKHLNNESKCIFYNENQFKKGCDEYELRPLYCRIFGFDRTLSNEGKWEISTCSILSNEYQENLYNKNENACFVNGLPSYTDYVKIISGLNPILTRNNNDINVSFRIAMEYIGKKIYSSNVIKKCSKETRPAKTIFSIPDNIM
jgi:uncharacterized protein